MSNNYFSANKSLTGGALFLTFNSKDSSVYMKLLKQIANNPNKQGNFDGKNPVNVKLSQDEAADLIRAVRTNGACSFYHKFNDDVTTISFKHFEIVSNQPNVPSRQGFGMTVKKNNVEIKIGFSLGGAERLKLFLTNALNHIFDWEHREDVKQLEEYRAKRQENANKNQAEASPPDESPSSPENQVTTEPDF